MIANPYAYLKAAARGDLTAQRALADMAIQLLADPEADPASTLLEGLVFARMAAAQSNDAGDAGRVISMLAVGAELAAGQGDMVAHDTFLAEGLARISRIGNLDNALLDVTVHRLMEDTSPEGLALAKAFETSMNEGGLD